MSNVSLFISFMTGMLALDTIVVGIYLKTLRGILGELAATVLLGAIAWLLSLDGAAKTMLEGNPIFGCILALASLIIIATIWAHVAEIVDRDRRRRKRRSKHSTPSQKKENTTY